MKDLNLSLIAIVDRLNDAILTPASTLLALPSTDSRGAYAPMRHPHQPAIHMGQSSTRSFNQLVF